jgi:hypothetical protein
MAKRPGAIQDQAQSDNLLNGANPASSSALTTQPRSVNLSHIHLFHHFERVVSKLLVLDTSFWVEHVLSISLKVSVLDPFYNFLVTD